MSDKFTDGAAWQHGRVIPIEQATISVTDWGLTHADCVYDVVPVWRGGFFRLGDYLERFSASVREARMEIGLSEKDIHKALHHMVAKSGLKDAYVAMVAARGTPMVPGIRDPRACKNHFYAWCVPYVHVVKPEVIEAGLAVWLSDTVRRIPEDSINPRVKNYHWGDFTQALFEAKEHGYETALLVDHDGNVTEGPGFNAFILKGKEITTPDRGVLIGITRRTAIELAKEAGFAVTERTLSTDELFEADEVFLTSSGGGIFPVTKINDRVFGNGRSGTVASALREAYFKRLSEPAYRSEIKYSLDKG